MGIYRKFVLRREVTYSYITNKCKVTDVFNEGVARVENMLLLCTYELCNDVIYRVKQNATIVTVRSYSCYLTIARLITAITMLIDQTKVR